MGRSGDPRRRAGARAFVGLGQYAEANPGRQRSARASMDEEVTAAIDAGQHYWLALAQHHLSDASAAVVAGISEGTPILDTETLRGIDTGCFICEQQLTAALLGTRCPGDPNGYRP